jgi:acylphosphatase
MVRVRVTVRGRVQGVGFRYATQTEARVHGVHGWVRNLPDGAVEAELEGDPADVALLREWMRHGPAGALVESLEVADADPTGATAFDIRATPLA